MSLNNNKKKIWNENFLLEPIKLKIDELGEQGLTLLAVSLFNDFKFHENQIRNFAKSGDIVFYGKHAVLMGEIYEKFSELIDYLEHTYGMDAKHAGIAHLYNYVDIAFGDECNRLTKTV